MGLFILSCIITALTIDQINFVLRQDEEIPTNLDEQYSDCFVDCVSNNWNNICSSMTLSPRLYCSQFSYRLAQFPPEPRINYWPEVLANHFIMVRFVYGILLHHFARRNRPVYINFSPSCLCMNNEGQTHYLYSSRSNFGCLSVSYLIHNYETLNTFCTVILGRYSLLAHMERQLSQMEANYEGLCFPVSLCFHLQACHNRIFGGKGQIRDVGLSGGNCCNSNLASKYLIKNMCVWRALSTMFDTMASGQIFERNKKPNRNYRPSNKIAKKLKLQFLSYYRRNHCGEFQRPIYSEGFNELFFNYLEKFLRKNIVIYSYRVVKGKKMGYRGLESARSNVRLLDVEYGGCNYFNSTVNLLSETRNDFHVRAIFDPNRFSCKLICPHCLQGFIDNSKLKGHNCLKKCYRYSKLYHWKCSSEKICNKGLSGNLFKKDAFFGHILVNHEKNQLVVKLRLKLSVGSCLMVKEIFRNVQEVAKYLLIFLPEAITHVLAKRYHENLVYLTQLEVYLNELSRKSSESLCKEDGWNIEYKQMLAKKSKVIDYLSTYCIYIQCDNTNLGDNLMYALLSDLMSGEAIKKPIIDIRYKSGKLNQIHKQGFPVKFINLNLMNKCFSLENVNEGQFEKLDQVINIFESDMEISIIGMHSTTEIGSYLLANTLSDRDIVSFYSPPKELYYHLESVVKFGLLASSPGLVIHADSNYKSAICCDFSRFYARLSLSENKPIWFKGHPIIFEQNEKGIFMCNPNRKRQTFANMVLNLIDHCLLEGEIRFALHGTEARFIYPVDGFFMNGQKKVLFFIDGCYYHSHMTECHKNSKEKNETHSKSCIICKNSLRHNEEKDWRLKPRLFQLKEHEGFDSNHSLKKNMTYRQVYQDTLDKRQKIRKEYDVPQIVITECTILEYFYSDLGSFFDFIGLPMKPEYKNVLFHEMYTNLAYETFPLLKYKSSLTKQKVLDAIKMNELHGYVILSASCGPISQTELGVLAPFTFKNEQGVSQSTFEVKDKLVTTIYLRELLISDRLSDFKVSKISKIFEFCKQKGNPFLGLKAKFLSSLAKNKSHPEFNSMLKSSLNQALGCISYVSSNHIKSVLVNHQESRGLLQMRNFSHATKVDTEHSLWHFKDKKPIKNISHIHYSLIEAGKAVMLHFILAMRTFFAPYLSLQRVNTDGAVLAATKSQLSSNLGLAELTSIVLDVYLSGPLDWQNAQRYICFKKRFFTKLGFCDHHELNYLQHLMHMDREWFIDSCCGNYINCEPEFPMNFEFLADKGVIVSKNKLSLANTALDTNYTKCSGFYDCKLSSIKTMSLDELIKLIN